MNIAVLGPSQSGKTCLAVGLANTSYGKRPFRRAFVAKALEDSSDLLNRFRKQIEGSKWPLGTDETDTLHFVFQRKGESVPIRFNDYKGERSADPDFLKKLDLGKLGSGDGVVLLVNPGFNFDCVREADGTVRFAEDFEVAAGAKPEGHATVSAFDDSPLARQWLADRLHVYEQIVERLETDDEGGNKSDKPVVALAVTASDRLRRKGDLRYLRPRFLAFLEQIENKLETAGFRWKRFEVSVTGSLEDQSKPKLASGFANTSSKPFVWLLGEPGRAARRKTARRTLGVALAAALFLAGLYGWAEERKAGRDVAERIRSCNEALGRSPFGAADLKTAAGAVEALRGHSGFHAGKAAEKAAELEPSVWNRQADLIGERIRAVEESDGRLGSRKDFGEIDDLFDAFVPAAADPAAERGKLRAGWEAKKPGLSDAHAEWVFAHEVEGPLRASENGHGLAAMDVLYPLSDRIRGLDPKTDRLVARKADLAARLDARIGAEWRDFAVPDFEKAASSGASDRATRAFVARLDAWNPATADGAAAKAALAASVSAAVPAWRKAYETAAFSARTDAAVKSGSPEELARLFPPRVEIFFPDWHKRA